MMRLSIVTAFSVCAFGASVLAQTPSPAPPPAAAVAPPQAPLRMAFLDLQRIAAESTEGKVASSQVQALTQKKTAELADKTKALKANQEKLQQGGSVLNDAARAQIEREIQRLTTEIDRYQEDANAEVQELQQSLQKDFEGKLRPIVDALVKELAIGLLFSASDAGAIYVDPSLDITGEVIKRFDANKGTAAPAAAKPAAPGAAKPAAPATVKPATPPPAAPPAAPPAK